MIITPGDIVRLRDGDLVYVTSTLDQTAPEVIENPDDLFLGYFLKYSPVIDRYFRKRDKLVVNTISEVVAIETDIVVE